MPDPIIHPASFRDPSGFIFKWNSTFYRQVNKSYADDYDLFISSGLYNDLVRSGMLIPHSETEEIIADKNKWYKTLRPEQVSFISYPYEWCFDQLKDAALLTISILREAIDHGMILKDSTPYNIQFINGRPVFIDTLSFEKYDENVPWTAYRQFCMMFLFPLYLGHYLKTDINRILAVYPDGIPAGITAQLLPLRSRASLGVWLHVYLQNTIAENTRAKSIDEKFTKVKLLNVIQQLQASVQNLKSPGAGSSWSNYYTETISSSEYLKEKENVFRKIMDDVKPASILDLGANDGYFSKIAAEKNVQVIATDNDSNSINHLYLHIRQTGTNNILPLVIDVANPTAATGFNNAERPSFHERIKTDLVVALAVLHHLVIGKNITLELIASWLKDISKKLIIEFIPLEDEKVQFMLAGRKNIFHGYTASAFERIFTLYFNIKYKEPVHGSSRTIYLMEKR